MTIPNLNIYSNCKKQRQTFEYGNYLFDCENKIKKQHYHGCLPRVFLSCGKTGRKQTSEDKEEE